MQQVLQASDCWGNILDKKMSQSSHKIPQYWTVKRILWSAYMLFIFGHSSNYATEEILSLIYYLFCVCI